MREVRLTLGCAMIALTQSGRWVRAASRIRIIDSMIFNIEQPPPCSREQDIYYSPDEDGRTEIGRVERESLAAMVCVTECPFRIKCLERALVTGEFYGVWGGMGEGERRLFKQHLLSEGYAKGEYPTGAELKSCLTSFYYLWPTAEERIYPETMELVDA